MTCVEARRLLDAYLDGEIGGRDVLELESHLAQCASCATVLEARRALRESLAAADLRHRLPPASEQRLRAMLGGTSAPSPQRPVRRPSWRRIAALAASVAVVLGAFEIGRMLPRDDGGDLVAAAVSSHVRSLLAPRPEDVLSSDHHTVKPWFSGKLDFAPEVIDLAADGFPLSGGRLDDLAGRRVAALVYHAGNHRISLFTWPATGNGAAPQQGAAGDGNCEDPGAPLLWHGYRVLRWTCGGMVYVAVSDAGEDSLLAFARRHRTAVSPPPR